MLDGPVQPGTRIPERGTRILIAQPGFLGDVVLSTPLIRAVRNCWPHGQLAVMVRPEAVPLLDGLPFIDHVFADRPASRGGLGRGGQPSLSRRERCCATLGKLSRDTVQSNCPKV